MRAGFASLGVSSTRGRIARSRNTSVGPWLRSIFVVAAVVWGLVAVGAHAGLASGDHHAVHPPHALLTAVGAEFAVDVGHAHLVDGSGSSHHPEQFASAVLPRSATALAGLALVVAVVATVMGVLAGVAVSAGRGPPFGLASVVTGRDRLTRFCLARR